MRNEEQMKSECINLRKSKVTIKLTDFQGTKCKVLPYNSMKHISNQIVNGGDGLSAMTKNLTL